jgi:hypothetical protein
MTTNKADLAPANRADVIFGPGPYPGAPFAVTVAQLTAVANKRIECWIPADSQLGFPRTAVTTDATSHCDTSSYNFPIRTDNGDITFDVWRYLPPAGTDDAWDLFVDTVFPKPTMYLIDCPAGFSGSGGTLPAVGDIIDFYVCLVGSRSKTPRGGDGLQRATISLSVLGFAPDLVVS